jgi:hypothetical protein
MQFLRARKSPSATLIDMKIQSLLVRSVIAAVAFGSMGSARSISQDGGTLTLVLPGTPCTPDVQVISFDGTVVFSVVSQTAGQAFDECAFTANQCKATVKVTNQASSGGVLAYSHGGTGAIDPKAPKTPIAAGMSASISISKDCGPGAGSGTGEGITVICGGAVSGAAELQCPCDW